MRFVHICLMVLAFIALGVSSPQNRLSADPLPGQEGLPPELTISAQPPLDDQIDALEDLADYAAENAPETGIIASIKNMFSGGEQVPAVNIGDLAISSKDKKGRRVAVEGIYEIRGEGKAVFHTEGARCYLELAGGTRPQGFPDSGPEGLPARAEGTVEIGQQGLPLIRVQKLTPALALSSIRLGRAYELDEEYEDAVAAYKAGAQVGAAWKYKYAPFARVHAAELALAELKDKGKAAGLYDATWDQFAGDNANGEAAFYTWTRLPAAEGWKKQTVRATISEPLDNLKSGGFWYGLVNAFVGIAGGSPALGLLLLAVVTRLLVYPLTKKQLVSMQAMQKIQPQIKKLQKKYKDDKQKFQEEFWKLCKEHGVNPLGGCLPLLIQMPILIMIYRGIRDYVVQFDQASFLWIDNLAQPNLPLLIAYAISMIFFQKMTQKMNPAAAMDPQQAQQQKMMAYLMPLMFFFLFQSFPAAFILYWLGTNLVSFAEQYWILHFHSEPKDKSSGEIKRASGGFTAAMSKLVSMGDNTEDEAEGKLQSYEETKAVAAGKKVGKETDKPDKRD